MAPQQRYVSDELTHFVGRSLRGPALPATGAKGATPKLVWACGHLPGHTLTCTASLL